MMSNASDDQVIITLQTVDDTGARAKHSCAAVVLWLPSLCVLRLVKRTSLENSIVLETCVIPRSIEYSSETGNDDRRGL